MQSKYNGILAWLKKGFPGQIHACCYAYVLYVMTNITEVCIQSITFFGLLNSITSLTENLLLIIYIIKLIFTLVL